MFDKFTVMSRLSRRLRTRRKAHHLRSLGLRTRFPNIVASDVRVEAPVTFLDYVAVQERVFIGKYSYIVSGALNSNVTIGRFCSMSREIAIGEVDHPTRWLTTAGVAITAGENIFHPDPFQKVWFQDDRATVVGHDVWLGFRCVVRRGIKIGDGAIVGSGAVVTRDVEPYAIVGGVPARTIGYRFEPAVISELLELEWWNAPEDQISDLPWDDVHKSIRLLKDRRKA